MVVKGTYILSQNRKHQNTMKALIKALLRVGYFWIKERVLRKRSAMIRCAKR